jgi:hypothetical protein
MDKSLPVLIIAFLREKKTLTLLESLALMGARKIYVSMDRGRNVQEIDLQETFLVRLNEIGKKYQLDLKIRVLLQNQGLAVSVISAADWFFQNEDFGIILEDDLVPVEKFFDFCSENRELIEIDDSYLLISGNSFGNSSDLLEPTYVNYPLIWGWATTRSKWKQMKDEITIRNYFSWKILSHPGKSGYFITGLLRARRGKIDSWAVPLASRMYFGKYKCLIPPTNLVANSGDDENSTHSNSNDWTLDQPIKFLSSANYQVENVHYSPELNRIIEKAIYGIRWYHLFGPINSLFFDRFRKFETRQPLLDRLRQSK